ncbi:MAG: hypothetical protein R3338_01190 [Thermoanaerobaculia bacterium]|nr:hypothetical protein [Thermoanaerobaculia bacterium]
MNPTDLPDRLRSSVSIVTDDEMPNPQSWMTAEELAEAEKIRNDRRRAEWMLGRVAAKRLAIDRGFCAEPQECSVPSRGIRPTLVLHGRPSELNLSLSHSGEIAAAIISERLVGIDVQKRRTIPARSTKFFLRDDESDLAIDPDDVILLDLWSAKEAALKASGVSRYRQVLLRNRRVSPDRTSFRFEAGRIAGEVETVWLAGDQVILAIARESV